MSGAEPCTGSYSPTAPPTLAEASRPSEPHIADASSLRMSPKRLPVSTTSKRAGFVTSSMAARSTNMCVSSTDGYSEPTSETTRRQSCDASSTFALSTEVTRPRLRRASSNATRATRSISWSSYARVLTARAPSDHLGVP